MRRAPERIAWAILLSAFVIFCLIVVAVPLGVRNYLLHAEVEHRAVVESLGGTVVVEFPVGPGPVPLGKGQNSSVPEGTVIHVDETSEALVTLFDRSVMRVYSGTTVRLERLRSPRYRMSPQPNALYLNLSGGHVYIGTAPAWDTLLDFRVRTLQGESVMDADGSYVIEANNARSEISAYRGRVRVMANDQTVELGPSQRTQIELNRAPRPPMGIARNLVANGDFDPLGEDWRSFSDQGTDGGNVDGHVESVVDEGRRAVRFWRTSGQGNHCETVLEQSIDQRLPDPIRSLVVRAIVKVRYQSLSGGGYLSSEYPLMIRLTYRDAYDSEAEWVQGFYYQNVDANPTAYGLQIPQDRWYLFESGNLLESLPIKPFKLIGLRVYASGWDYESLISDISLIAE